MINTEKLKESIGQLIEVKTNDNKEFSGLLINILNNVVIIKLNNGYNIGFKAEEIKSYNILKTKESKVKRKTSKKQQNEVTDKKDKPTISILHTGGTIASKVDYTTGAVVARFSPEDILNMFPELKAIANFRSRLLGNILSENMRPEHYNLIADAVEEELNNGSDGVIITHGTDTMHYTSAALSFMLDGLNKPVILVGAQRSSDRASSDAYLNLINAAFFIKNTNFAGVAICMHKNLNDTSSAIMLGTKVRKMHTSRRDAFKAINIKPLAVVNYKKNEIRYNLINYNKKSDDKKLNVKHINPKVKVALLKSFPGIRAEILESFRAYDGLVIEGTGLGHLPIVRTDELTEENEKIKKALDKLSKNTILVITSQTIFGRINLNVYSPGRMLKKIGFQGDLTDMTPETAFIKLYWLLSNYSKEDIIKNHLVEKNLRGEISPRSDESFLEFN